MAMQIYTKRSLMTKAITRAMATRMRDMASTQISAPRSLFDLTNVCYPSFMICNDLNVSKCLSDVSKVISIDDVEGIGQLFESFCVSQTVNGTV